MPKSLEPRLLIRVWALTANAGKVRLVKKMACYLLLAWLTLMSGGAYAHALHAHDQPAPVSQSQMQTPSLVLNSAPEAHISQVDSCNHTHCGHGHAVGMLTAQNTNPKTDAKTAPPSSRASWVSSLIASNIERPKWLLTTPAVVSLLN
jgi:hypothetical protein